MKKILIIGLVCLFFLVAVGLVAYKLFPSSSPKQTGTAPASLPLPTQVQEQDQASVEVAQLKRAFLNKIINGDQISLERTKIVSPYAIQDWSDDNKGGEALLHYTPEAGWDLVSMGGGAWDLQSLIDAGVPSDIAHQLLGQ